MLRYLFVGLLLTAGLIGGQLYLQQTKSSQTTTSANPLAGTANRSLQPVKQDTRLAQGAAASQLAERQQAKSRYPDIGNNTGASSAVPVETKSSAWQKNESAATTPARYANKGLDARPLLVNKSKIANLAIGDSVQLPIPQTGQEYEMSVQEVGRHQNGDKSLKGYLIKDPDYTVVMTEGKSATFATINTPDGSFVLEAAGDQGWMLSMNDLDSMVDPNLVDYRIPEFSRR
jgi:hypothetical protein